jgi:adenylate kinase family enzyme
MTWRAIYGGPCGSDDTEPIVRARLQVYNDNAVPVEDFYKAEGKLTDFAILAGIPVGRCRLTL